MKNLWVSARGLIDRLRLALTGSAVSPGAFGVMHLRDGELVLGRVDDAIAHLRDA